METKKRILITGGTGYIGSHTVADFLENGNYEVVSLDSYLNSSPAVVERIQAATKKQVVNHAVDLCDSVALEAFFAREEPFDGIIHFAALKSVPDSVRDPLYYYRNNVISLLNILTCCEKFGIKNFIFSSSCSVYGNATSLPVSEDTPFGEAESPYANSKQIGEDILKNYCRHKSAIRCLALRYFNPVGAHESGLLGEDPVNPPTNLAPIITQTAIGIRSEMSVFGADYPTRDGTCIRDYIHVSDIAEAHRLALEFVCGMDDGFYDVVNLGTGDGVSVLEMIQAFEKVSGVKLNYKIAPRRQGDVIAVYSDTRKSREVLGWAAKRNTEEMMRTAWLWEKNLREK
jgi:UDP-glucose 4-epimerase